MSAIASICLTPAPVLEVYITSLELTGFRNHRGFGVSLDAAPVVITGPNGAGKTNLMEAISLLAPGRGLRRARPAHIPTRGDGEGEGDEDESIRPWSVSAGVVTAEGALRAGTGVAALSDGDDESRNATSRRIIRIDGETSSQTELGSRFAVSWLTPDMDQVLGDSPSMRRRFLDRLVIAFDPAHNGRLQRHDKAARQRGRLMDDGSDDGGWFDALEAEIAASGVAIIAARKAMVEALDCEAATPFGDFPMARLSLEGEAEAWMDAMPAVDVEDRIRAAASDARAAGDKSLPGASASVLKAVHSGTGAEAGFSSTGEQKALVISVILAHARLQAKRLGRPPIMLLDDIASHLDAASRAALFDLACGLSGQVWFSGTDAGIFDGVPGGAKHITLGGP